MMPKGRPIPGYPGYTVTMCGEVYDPNGVRRPEYLSGIPQYKYVNMPVNTPKGWQLRRVNVLVALAWLPNPNGYRVVDHKDRDKLNNHKDNLVWCTHGANQLNVGERNISTAAIRATIYEMFKETPKTGMSKYQMIWRRIREKGMSAEQAWDDVFPEIPFPAEK